MTAALCMRPARLRKVWLGSGWKAAKPGLYGGGRVWGHKVWVDVKGTRQEPTTWRRRPVPEAKPCHKHVGALAARPLRAVACVSSAGLRRGVVQP
jgi:hypothetical protein